MPRLSVNGHVLFYADDDFIDPWLAKDAVFLQPYLFGSHLDLRRWVPILGQDFRVIRLDRYGLGKSERPRLGYTYTLAGLVADVIATLDILGLQAVHYIGESIGGVLGAAVAAQHPERVKSLVMCHTPLAVRPQTQRLSILGGYPDGPTAVMAMGSWAFAHSMGNLTDADTPTPMQLWSAQQRSQIPAHVQAALMRMAHEPAFDITDTISSIQAPTLLISPSDSIVTSPQEQEAMCQQIANCEQITLEWSRPGHAWVNPTEPAARAREFLRRAFAHESRGSESLVHGPITSAPARTKPAHASSG